MTWPRFTWQIYWNYQGLPAYGTLTTRAWAYPHQLGQGQTGCPGVGNQTTQRCVLVQWPLKHSAYDQNRGNVPYLSWHGSLLEGKRDRSGLQYNRNRMYDPQTGRFTQEDPVGPAGGLNLYGYANGDPINLSDPFGLSADTLEAVTASHTSTELPTTASRSVCVDRSVATSVRSIFADATAVGIAATMNNAYRGGVQAGTGGRPAAGTRSPHRAGFAFDINSSALTATQLADFTRFADTHGFDAVAGDPGHYQARSGAAAQYGTFDAGVVEADRSYGAGECTDQQEAATNRNPT